MDTRKPNADDSQGDGSDDLMAELARLVGQDARPDRVAPAQPAPRFSAPPVERSEPRFTREPSVAPAGSVDDIEFDFGFGAPAAPQDDPVAPDPVQAEAPLAAEIPHDAAPADDEDPIAALIAGVEVEDERRESDRWHDDDSAAAPEPADQPVFADEPYRESVASDPYTAIAADPVHDGPDESLSFEPDPEPAQRDPLSEIEALIGDAARVTPEPVLSGGRRVRSIYAADPVVDTPPPSAAPAPAEDEAMDAVSAAEQAILAAAAASAVHAAPRPVAAQMDAPRPARALPEAEDMVYEDDLIDDGDFVQPRAGRRRGGLVMPVVLGTVILVALVGGYVVLFGGDDTVSGDAPVLVADGEPAKAEPELDTGSGAGQSVVFNDIDGQAANPADSTLVSRDETAGASGQQVTSMLSGVREDTETGLANRSVRTVTVRPDGTIVSGEADTNVAGGALLPVDRPAVPDIPGGLGESDPIGDAIAEAMGGAGPVAELTVAQPADTPAETDAAPDVQAIPLPIPRPANLPTTVASVPSAPAPAPVASPSASGPVGAWVQLSSQRTEEAARGGMPELQSRYGALFNGAALEVNSVDLGAQGIYYRVRLPQPSMSEANTVCNAIRAQGGDCFVLPN